MKPRWIVAVFSPNRVGMECWLIVGVFCDTGTKRYSCNFKGKCMSKLAQATQASVTAGAKALWVEQLILLAVLILPVMVLFKRVPAEIAVGLTVIIGIGVAIRRKDFSWLATEWFYAAAAMSLILLVLSPFSLNPGYSAMSAVLAVRWPIFAAVLIWLFVSRPRALALF
jgi:hypothetical protein